MGDKPAVELKYGLPEHLQGKKQGAEPVKVSHEEGDRRYMAEEWVGAGPDSRETDTGVPGTQSPRGKPAETVEGREGWRD